jgi:hypothetical protein
MSLDAGYVTYNSIQDYQNWLHSSQNKVETPFYHDHIRVGWHSTFLEKMEPIITDNDITFIANGNAHFLLYTNLVFHTPEVNSQQTDVKVAWTPNLLHNYVKSAELKFNDILVQRFDTVGADIMVQLDPRPGEGKRNQYLRDIGNLPHLINFSHDLPKTRLCLHCPWSFSKKISKCIPLCLSTTTVVSMKFTLQQDPMKLIRIREEINGKGHLRALDCNDSIKINELPLPEFYGKYALITPKEIKWQKEISNREVFYDTFLEYDAKEFVKRDESSEVVLSSNSPVRALFPVVQNIDAAKINNHSNYTTNPFDSCIGSSPISRYTLYYDMVKVLDNIEAEVFSNDEPYWACEACPEKPGYGTIVFSSTLERDEDVGVVLSSVNGKLKVDINESYSDLSTYHLKVRALVTNVFKYENNMVTKI